MARNKKRKKKAACSARQERAIYKKKLKCRFLQYLKDIKLEEIYGLLPKFETEFLVCFGMKPLEVKPAEGQEITAKILNTLKKVVYNHMKAIPLMVQPDGTNVSLYDYYQAGEWVTYLIRNEGIDFKNKDKVTELAKDYMACIDNGSIPLKNAESLGFLMSHLFCSPLMGYILFNFELNANKEPLSTAFDCYYITFIERQSYTVEIRDKKRMVYRVGFPEGTKNIRWVSVTPDKCGINSFLPDLMIDVYIQKHALYRLRERLDTLNDYSLNMFMSSSLLKFKIKQNSHQQKLLLFEVDDKKVGYFRYEYVEGILVLTTFLLITNNGTPEGEKLHEILGIDKKDKQYLGIDKLSGFVNTNLKEDERIRDIFNCAGCGGLFEIPPEYLKGNTKNEAMVERFVQYLELDKQPEEEFELYEA